jgi:putative DNA primase/helicase
MPLNSSNEDWNKRLLHSKNGDLMPVVENVVQILTNDIRWAGVLGFNEFSGQIVKMEPPPFEYSDMGEWTEIDEFRLELWLTANYRMRKGRANVLSKAVTLVADTHKYHEVRDYLNSLEWDGVPRLASMLAAYFGADLGPNNEREEYVASVSVKWMVGAVARIYRPGIHMNNILILKQALDKGDTSALQTLFNPWYTDVPFELDSGDAHPAMRGMWCVKLACLEFTSVSTINEFLTRSSDRYRAHNRQRLVYLRRQSVVATTVDYWEYLQDDPENPRYWSIVQSNPSLADLAADRNQLWAEAVHLYRLGVPWWVTATEKCVYKLPPYGEHIANRVRTLVTAYLNTPNDQGVKRLSATMSEIITHALQQDAGKCSLMQKTLVGRIMAGLGWTRKRETSGVHRGWYYRRPFELPAIGTKLDGREDN